MGHLTALLKEIKPAVNKVKKDNPKMDKKSKEFAHLVEMQNVKQTVLDIQKKSSVIRNLVKEGKVKVIGGMYDISTGQVTYL